MAGFDLVLGKLYNDYWFNRAEPLHNYTKCSKCGNLATLHRLEKLVFAFGNMTIKTCDVFTCPVCLHEVLQEHKPAPRQKATKQNLVKLFSKLPLAIQKQILMKGGE